MARIDARIITSVSIDHKRNVVYQGSDTRTLWKDLIPKNLRGRHSYEILVIQGNTSRGEEQLHFQFATGGKKDNYALRHDTFSLTGKAEIDQLRELLNQSRGA